MPLPLPPAAAPLPLKQPRPRILITRTRHQASELAAQLETVGAETILVPMIEVAEPASFAALDSAIKAIASAEDLWLVFTSANAVHALAARARQQATALHPRKVAAIGPATAKAMQQAGLAPSNGQILLPPRYVAESLAETLIDACRDTATTVLLVRAEEARDVIPTNLQAAGISVTIASAYRNITPADTLASLARIFATPDTAPGVITFTSSSTATNLITLLQGLGIKLPSRTALASIGPVTSATLQSLGFEPTFEAAEPTIPSLVAAIAAYLGA